MGSLQREKSGRRNAISSDSSPHSGLASIGCRWPMFGLNTSNRNELAPSTMNAKRVVWMHFAKWMEHSYLAVDDFASVTEEIG